MGRGITWGVLMCCACGAQLGDGSNPDATIAGDTNEITPPIDAAIDAPGALGAWSTPTKVPGGDSAVDEDDEVLSSNGLEMLFKRNDAGDANLYVMKRDSLTSAWRAPTPITELNTATTDEAPRFADNDLTLYFGRNGEIFKATRNAPGQTWTNVAPVTSLNTTAYEKWAAVCSNGYVLISRSTTANAQDLFEGTISGGANTAVATLNTTANEQGVLVTNNCTRVYFQSSRTGAKFDIYTATRSSMAGAWSSPTPLPDFNTALYDEEDGWISADQRTFLFASNSAGNKDLYISTR